MKGKGFSEGIEGTKMQDGTEAWKTPSGLYFCRAEPSYEDRQSIAYFTLDGVRIPLAKGKCEKCGDVVESKMCGDFQRCKCGASAVDTDRWFPERHRFIGPISNEGKEV